MSDDEEEKSSSDSDSDDDDEASSSSSYSSFDSDSSSRSTATSGRSSQVDSEQDRREFFLQQIEELRGNYLDQHFKAPYKYERVPLVRTESAFHEDWVEVIDGRQRMSKQRRRDYTTLEKVLTQDPEAPDWIVVHGFSGTGKTALVRWIASEWARGNLWPNLLLVLAVEFRKLDADHVPDPYLLHNFDGLEDLIWENRERVLFVIDDYEMVAHMDTQAPSWVRNLFSRIREFPRWIFVSRTDCIQPLIDRKMTRSYRLGLMDDRQRSQFISNVFAAWEERRHQPDTERLMFSFPPNIETEVALHEKLNDDEELCQLSFIPLISKMICKAFTNGIKTSKRVKIFVLARLLRRYFKKYRGEKTLVVRDMEEATFFLQGDLVRNLIGNFLAPSNPERQDIGPCLRGLIASSSSSSSVSSVLSSSSSASSSSSSKAARKRSEQSLRDLLNAGIFVAWIVNCDRYRKLQFNYRSIHSTLVEILPAATGLG